MWIRLELTAESGAPEIKEFNQARITIGRSHKSDVVLRAENASREHAVIECQEEAPYLIGKGQLPTLLNGQEMTAGATQRLSSGDRIAICGQVLSFQILAAPPNQLETIASTLPPPMTPSATPNRGRAASPWRKRTTDSSVEIPEASLDQDSKLSQEAKTLARELDNLYHTNATTDPAKRRSLLKEFLKKRIMPFDGKDRAEMIRILKDRFYNKEEVLERVISENQELQAKLEAYGGKERQAMAAYEALSAVAEKLVAKARPFQTEAELSIFCENLRQIMEMLLRFFYKLDKGRLKSAEHKLAQLETELAEPTPLQKAQSLPELGQYLFNWDNPEDRRQAHAQLESALNDLLSHELALQAGYDSSLWSGAHQLLHRLNPDKFEEEVGNETGFWKIPKKWLGPLHGWFSWRKYKKDFANLQQEKPAALRAWFRAAYEEAYRKKFQELRAGR